METIKCPECGYIGYSVCKNCGKTEVSCVCGHWLPSCPACGQIIKKGDEGTE